MYLPSKRIGTRGFPFGKPYFLEINVFGGNYGKEITDFIKQKAML